MTNKYIISFFLYLFIPSLCFADGSTAGHSDPFSLILLSLGLVIFASGLGRFISGKFNQPPVLGELLVGVLIGNLLYFFKHPLGLIVMHLDQFNLLGEMLYSRGSSTVDLINDKNLSGLISVFGTSTSFAYSLIGTALWIFSNLGIIFLLFLVGLENNVKDMLKVGPSAFAVAVVGVIAPSILGFLFCTWMLPDNSFVKHLFLAATLCATSVGITARVLKDLNKSQVKAARIILGAAVIDDVLGLIVLALVVGIINTGEFNLIDLIKLSLISITFFTVLITLGDRLIQYSHKFFILIFKEKTKFFLPLFITFILAWFSNFLGLAAIVGAFAAGLIFSDEHFEGDSKKTTLHELFSPFESVFAPIFFVLMGMQVNLQYFVDLNVLGLGLGFTVVGIIGKVVAGFVVKKDSDPLSVGIGMIPRGEVGLIFASIGKSLSVVSDAVYAAVVIMVVLTTLITPILLKWSLSRKTYII